MKVLVTGGTGVIGLGAVTALVKHGHKVRVLSRNADEDAKQWPEGVEAFPGTITDFQSIRGSAHGCDVVLHIAGVAEERPPDITFQNTNVEGTRNVVHEAQLSKAKRFVFVSSLGVEVGSSDYHKSKLRGEEIVKGFPGEWVIVRPGNVYGPGDDVVALLLRLVRSLPAVPIVDGGDDEFQPIWTDDLAEIFVQCVERDDLRGRVFNVAGPEKTTMNNLIDRLNEITGRSVVKVPVSSAVLGAGIKVASILHVNDALPISEAELKMLKEGNLIRIPTANALGTVFDIKATKLDEGLRKLADALPEQLPDEGVGVFQRKRIWADISGSEFSPEVLMERVRKKFDDLTPWTVGVGAEPGTRKTISYGATLTMKLPVRGNIQVRVEEFEPRSMTFVTLEGHPLAGAIRFLSEQRGEQLRFEVQVYDRPAGIADWIIMRTIGDTVQTLTWESLIKSVVEESEGSAPEGSQFETVNLDTQQAQNIEAWLRDLITARKRSEGPRPSAEKSTVSEINI